VSPQHGIACTRAVNARSGLMWVRYSAVCRVWSRAGLGGVLHEYQHAA
jgi:hypothetical protein